MYSVLGCPPIKDSPPPPHESKKSTHTEERHAERLSHDEKGPHKSKNVAKKTPHGKKVAIRIHPCSKRKIV